MTEGGRLVRARMRRGSRPRSASRFRIWGSGRRLVLALAAGVALVGCADGERSMGPREPSGRLPSAAGGTAGGGAMVEAGKPVAAPPPSVPACRGGSAVPVFHRLNRTEYQNSVNDLLATDLPLREALPPDSLLEGFDNHADAVMSAPLLERYLRLATRAVEAALSDPAGWARLVPCALEESACRRRVLETFLPRAFRRPVTEDELQEHLGHFETCDDSPRAGLACALEAALISPNFLFRAEIGRAEVDPSDPAAGELGEYTLAERLAFFLWSSGPDARLIDLAGKRQLRLPETLAGEVDRMLADREQSRFTRPFALSFPTQWLELDGLDAAAPSKTVYPAFDEQLRAAMRAESERFFNDILDNNRSALELVRAPYTFVNERLAAHYGIAGVRGRGPTRVETTGSPRGGVLTQASFLTLTSSSEKTSIPQRARWVLRNLLCTSLDDPPPGAEEMVPPPQELGLTSRQSLERRTGQPPCNGCHAILNPLGFGLEIFDGIGASRSMDRGKPIDTSGVLPTGESFASTDELLDLLARDERFPMCLTRKLVTYAVGRRLEGPCDEETVRVLAAEFARDGYRLRNHVIRIVQSELFRSARRGPVP